MEVRVWFCGFGNGVKDVEIRVQGFGLSVSLRSTRNVEPLLSTGVFWGSALVWGECMV